MIEHYCQEHHTKFFKTVKMKEWAHPMKDSEGHTAGWCVEEETTPKVPPGSFRPFNEGNERQSSIETQCAAKIVSELIVGSKMTWEDELGIRLKAWLLRKLPEERL